MKYLISSFLFIVLFIGQTSFVGAHYPTVTLDFIEGVPVIPGEDTIVYVPYLPYTLDFEGTVLHEGHGNLNRVDITATVNGDLIYGPESLHGSGNDTVTSYSIPWVAEEETIQYQVVITALHPDSDGGGGGCKAAPAIAATYLKTSDLLRRENTKVIATVAQETGKNGELWAKYSCTETYIDQTITIVTELIED